MSNDWQPLFVTLVTVDKYEAMCVVQVLSDHKSSSVGKHASAVYPNANARGVKLCNVELLLVRCSQPYAVIPWKRSDVFGAGQPADALARGQKL